MPLGRQNNKLKESIVALVFAASSICTGYAIFSGYKRIAAAEKRVDELSSLAARQNKENGVLSSSLEGLLQAQSERLLNEYSAFESTVKITYSEGDDYRVGAGSVIFSVKNDNGFFDNYVITAGHNFEKFDEDATTVSASAKVESYCLIENDVLPKYSCDAKLLVQDEDKDWALVYFESEEKSVVARLADAESIMGIHQFAKIFTIGFPLDIALVKTNGELQAKGGIEGMDDIWLVTPNVFPGNSGGGVFLRDSGKLVGMVNGCAKLPLERNVDMPVSHIAFMTSFVALKDWLEMNKFGFVYDWNLSSK